MCAYSRLATVSMPMFHFGKGIIVFGFFQFLIILFNCTYRDRSCGMTSVETSTNNSSKILAIVSIRETIAKFPFLYIFNSLIPKDA